MLGKRVVNNVLSKRQKTNVLGLKPLSVKKDKWSKNSNNFLEGDKYNILVLVTENNKEDLVNFLGFNNWKDWLSNHNTNIVGNLIHLTEDDNPYYNRYKNTALTSNQIKNSNKNVVFLLGSPYGKETLYLVPAKDYRESGYTG